MTATTTTEHLATETLSESVRKSGKSRLLKLLAAGVALVTVAGLGTTAALANDNSSARPAVARTRSIQHDSGRPAAEVKLPSLPTSSATARTLHRPGEVGTEANGTGSWSSMYDFMAFVVTDAAAYWNRVYQTWGLNQTSSVSYVFPGPGESIDFCGGPTNDLTFAFCSGGPDEIVASQEMARQMWTGTLVGPLKQHSAITGDMQVAVALAHEYGHNVQEELGISESDIGTNNSEQMADCLAGYYTRDASARGILDPGDVNEAEWSLWTAGDTGAPGTHGTSDQRIAAFRLGLSNGNCWSYNHA